MIEEKLKTHNYLNYNGIVQIDLLDDNRKISSTVHNTGKQPLFEFIANCLLGNFKAAKSRYPSKIACYAEKENTSEYEKVSTYIHYDSTRYESYSDNGTAINFHFRIPYTCLINNKVIKKLKLFPNIISSDTDDCIAEIELANEAKIQVPPSGGNFTIIVN